jgi:hypothetical protein
MVPMVTANGFAFVNIFTVCSVACEAPIAYTDVTRCQVDAGTVDMTVAACRTKISASTEFAAFSGNKDLILSRAQQARTSFT